MGEISHLSNMMAPDHAAKSGKFWIIHEDDAAIIAAPDKLPLFGLEFVFTEYAISHGKNVNENGI
jgi:hypothetical protein